MATLLINGKSHTVDVDPGTPLLWVIRERLQLTGTKFGCGVAQCGACTVHLDGRAVRSCQTTVAQAAGKKITTIEGLDPAGRHPLQVAWIAEQVPQCGYCQSGQIMAAAALLARNPNPSDAEFGLMLTGGSWSVNWTFDALSRAGAAARLALIDAAAKSWNVSPADCVAERSMVRHLPSGRALRYGEIVARMPITKTFTE